jgi:hypothetical protein
MLACAYCYAATTILREYKPNGCLFQTVQVSPEDFGEESLVELAHSVLRRYPRRRVVALRIFDEEPPIGIPLMAWHTTYAYLQSRRTGWKQRYADLIALDGDATLRILEADGTVVRRVLGKHDPLRLRFENSECEVLFVGYWPASEVVEVYLQTDQELTAEWGRNVAETVRARVPTPATIRIRNDPWFVGGHSYPHDYPFAERPPPPPNELETSTTIVCAYGITGKYRCTLAIGSPGNSHRRAR